MSKNALDIPPPEVIEAGCEKTIEYLYRFLVGKRTHALNLSGMHATRALLKSPVPVFLSLFVSLSLCLCLCLVSCLVSCVCVCVCVLCLCQRHSKEAPANLGNRRRYGPQERAA